MLSFVHLNDKQVLHLPLPCCCVFVYMEALAFKPDIHEDVSKEACGKISHTIDGKVHVFQFDEHVLQIRKANSDSDAFFSDFWNEEVHFDNEKLALCSRRLINLRIRAVKALTDDVAKPNGKLARKLTGQAHHALQDFYAHSNWAELVGFGFRMDFNGDPGRVPLTDPGGEKFCPNDPDKVAKVDGITTGYFSLPKHSFFIPIPIVFAHLAHLETCQKYPPGKCRHGIDILSRVCDGINKDTPDRDRAGHATAKKLATEGSVDFIKQILNDPKVKNNVKAVEAYLGPLPDPTKGPTLVPTEVPTLAPTEGPTTPVPTVSPTSGPTGIPTSGTTDSPTCTPTSGPSGALTNYPTEAPTITPTEAPTPGPTPEQTPGPTPGSSGASPSPTPGPTPGQTPGPTHSSAPAAPGGFPLDRLLEESSLPAIYSFDFVGLLFGR